jgi:putative flippase GtrA
MPDKELKKAMKTIFSKTFYKYRKGIFHFLKFNFVGILNTGITFVIFIVLNKLFRVDPLIAEPIGYSIGLVNSFIMNKLWTFGKKHSFSVWEVIKFTIVNFIAFGGTWRFLYLNKTYTLTDPVIVKGLSLLFSIPCNYIGAKYWVFKD